jgi:hypothetical protein
MRSPIIEFSFSKKMSHDLYGKCIKMAQVKGWRNAGSDSCRGQRHKVK